MTYIFVCQPTISGCLTWRKGRGAIPPGGTHARRPSSKLKLNLRLIAANRPRPRKDELFETTHVRLNCYLTGVTDNPNGFTVFTDLQATIDKLNSNAGLTELKRHNLEPMVPQYLRARQTFFISGLDRHVGGRDADEIKTEIKRCNTWMTDLTVYEIKDYFHIFKVIFPESALANQTLTDGLTAFHCRISRTNVN